MAAGGPCEVRFEDIMVHLSTEEWQMLEKWQRELYFDVLRENYESLIIIGNPVTSSEVIAWFERGERQNGTESQESRSGDPSASENKKEFGSESERQKLPTCTKNGGFGQRYSKRYTETLELPKMVDSRFEEEMAQYGDLGGPPELLGVPLTQRGSPVRDECVPYPAKAAHGLASPVQSQVAARAPKLYACQECGKRFRFKGLLRIHHRVSLRKPSLPCPTCGACFPSSWHLKRHQRTHSRVCADGPGSCQGEERLHYCADCGESCHKYLDFLQHQKTHEEVKVWPCAQCNVTFMYQSDLVMHEENHIDEALCTCAACGENCVCRPSFMLHFLSRFEKSTENSRTDSQEDGKPPWDVKSELEKPYLCRQCGEQFRLEVNLQVHYRYCFKERLQKFRYGGTLPEHPKDRDKWVPNRPVPEASRNSSSPPSQPSSARWTCSHCRKVFSSRYGLRKHQQRHRAKQHQSTAELNKSASPARGFGGHTAVGIMKKLHKCQECGKRFVFKGQLVTHMKGHGKESCHRCPFCRESFGSKGSFWKHLQIHLGEGQPTGRGQKDVSAPAVAAGQKRQEEKELCQCAECGKTFTKKYFPDHQAWHAGLRHRCRLCGNICNFKSGGYRHLQQHRKKGDFSICPKCGNRSQSKCCLCLMERIYLGQKPLPPL